MWKTLLKKSKEAFEKINSEIENREEIVSIEIDSVDSEVENEDIQSHIKVLPNKSKFIDQSTKTLGALTQSSNSPINKSTSSGARFLNTPIYTMGANTTRIKDNVFDLTWNTKNFIFVWVYWWDYGERFWYFNV